MRRKAASLSLSRVSTITDEIAYPELGSTLMGDILSSDCPHDEAPGEQQRDLATIRHYLASAGRFRRLRYKYFHEDARCLAMFSLSGDPLIYQGHQEIIKLQDWIEKHFPDWVWKMAAIAHIRDSASYIVVCDGIGCFQSDGVFRPSRAVHYIHMFTMADGLILELKEFSDVAQKCALIGRDISFAEAPIDFIM